MHDGHAKVPLEDAWAIVDQVLAPTAVADETVPVRSAHGRILTEAQTSRLQLPPFEKSAMDGYAICPDDERDQYRLLETVAAGQTPSKKLQPGTTTKVMTGAPVPHGAGRVVMREFANEENGIVRISRHGGETNICLRGEDVEIGDTILPAGRKLSAIDVANLVSCGITEARVARRIRLAVLSTGNEIVDDPAQLTPGRIMNANGPMLVHLAQEHGLDVVQERSVPDDPDRTVCALQEALAAADLVVLSGGVSVGDYDFVHDALGRCGLHVHFSSIAVKPGRPTVFATQGEPGRPAGIALFGLPGNPVSVCLMFHLFVLRAASLLSGGRPGAPEIRLPLAEDFRRRKADRSHFAPAQVSPDGAVRRLVCHGSAHLLALSQADGFFRVPIGVKELPAGEIVSFYSLRGPWT